MGRFDEAIAAIDAANAADPATLAHAALVTGWVRRLDPDAGELQLLAARACHLRRFEHPRSSYPEGRAGYLRWRTAARRPSGIAIASESRNDAPISSDVRPRLGAITSSTGRLNVREKPKSPPSAAPSQLR